MTQQEYQQVLQKSELFQGLPKETQTILLDAETDEFDRFLQVVQESEQFMDKAQREMMENNEQVMKNFQLEMKSFRKDKINADEAHASKQEHVQSEKLLEELDNL